MRSALVAENTAAPIDLAENGLADLWFIDETGARRCEVCKCQPRSIRMHYEQHHRKTYKEFLEKRGFVSADPTTENVNVYRFFNAFDETIVGNIIASAPTTATTTTATTTTTTTDQKTYQFRCRVCQQEPNVDAKTGIYEPSLRAHLVAQHPNELKAALTLLVESSLKEYSIEWLRLESFQCLNDMSNPPVYLCRTCSTQLDVPLEDSTRALWAHYEQRHPNELTNPPPIYNSAKLLQSPVCQNEANIVEDGNTAIEDRTNRLHIYRFFRVERAGANGRRATFRCRLCDIVPRALSTHRHLRTTLCRHMRRDHPDELTRAIELAKAGRDGYCTTKFLSRVYKRDGFGKPRDESCRLCGYRAIRLIGLTGTFVTDSRVHRLYYHLEEAHPEILTSNSRYGTFTNGDTQSSDQSEAPVLPKESTPKIVRFPMLTLLSEGFKHLQCPMTYAWLEMTGGYAGNGPISALGLEYFLADRVTLLYQFVQTRMPAFAVQSKEEMNRSLHEFYMKFVFLESAYLTSKTLPSFEKKLLLSNGSYIDLCVHPSEEHLPLLRTLESLVYSFKRLQVSRVELYSMTVLLYFNVTSFGNNNPTTSVIVNTIKNELMQYYAMQKTSGEKRLAYIFHVLPLAQQMAGFHIRTLLEKHDPPPILPPQLPVEHHPYWMEPPPPPHSASSTATFTHHPHHHHHHHQHLPDTNAYYHHQYHQHHYQQNHHQQHYHQSPPGSNPV